MSTVLKTAVFKSLHFTALFRVSNAERVTLMTVAGKLHLDSFIRQSR